MVEFIEKNTTLCIVICAAVGLLWLSALIGKRICFVFLLPLFGGVLSATYLTGASSSASFFAVGCFLSCGGVGLLLVACVEGLGKRRAKKRAQKEERLRRIQFALPDKENAFVRERLHTVLQVPPPLEEERSLPAPVRFSYAKKLLAKVLEAPLSAAERLQAEDIGKTFSLYLKKEAIGERDLRGINETFAALLKLSAKYEVAI
ncbi:MAG: hypothetical protein E7380_05510 [Clostridiales bacterium]|nr:hypothetical protein [Clostridiales bacterium]